MSYPYFPFKLEQSDQSGAKMLSPYEAEAKINRSASDLLALCNGSRSLDEIAGVLAKHYDADEAEIVDLVQRFIQSQNEKGLIWIRKEKMRWYDAPAPESIFWEITAECNLRCQHCVVSADHKLHGELSLDECLNLIREWRQMGVKDITFSGGEPLMHKNFFELVHAVRKTGMQASLATNGTKITPAVAREIGRVSMNVQVSVDGSCAEIHEKFRGRRGSFLKAMDGIKALLNNDVEVTIGTVVTTHNVEDIPDILKLVQQYGVKQFRLIPFIPFGRGSKVKSLELSPSEMRKLTLDLIRQRETLPFEILPMEFEQTLCSPPAIEIDHSRPSECGGAVHYCTVTPLGEVLPCHYFEGVNADTVKEKTFREIWRESRFLNYFRSMQIADIAGHCQECDWLAACRGGCKAANFSQGALFHSNRHCWVADKLENRQQEGS